MCRCVAPRPGSPAVPASNGHQLHASLAPHARASYPQSKTWGYHRSARRNPRLSSRPFRTLRAMCIRPASTWPRLRSRSPRSAPGFGSTITGCSNTPINERGRCVPRRIESASGVVLADASMSKTAALQRDCSAHAAGLRPRCNPMISTRPRRGKTRIVCVENSIGRNHWCQQACLTVVITALPRGPVGQLP